MFEINKQAFGKFISELRKDKGMTQKELAERLFISDKAVSKWETGMSLPDITLLVPLADILEVSVMELLNCQRIPQNETMNTEQVEELVQKAITFSDESQDKEKHNTKWKSIYILSCFVAILELILISFISMEALLNVGQLVLMAIIFGCYFCIFVKEKLPNYYDENKISTYGDGVFRMNLAGVHFNNSNWPHIIKVIRIWTICMLTLYPLLGLLMYYVVTDVFVLLVPTLVVTLGGLLIPVYIVAKKYE